MTNPHTQHPTPDLPGPTPRSANRARRIGLVAALSLAVLGVGTAAYAATNDGAQPEYVTIVNSTDSPAPQDQNGSDTGAASADPTNPDCPYKSGGQDDQGQGGAPDGSTEAPSEQAPAPAQPDTSTL